MKKMNLKLMLVMVVLLPAIFLYGCKQTYSEDKIVQELQNICKTEYNIDGVQVKFAGATIGVYLPVKKLFNANLREAMAVSKLQNLESLLQPSQEALDQVENVLFSISRVVLSTDKKVDFYVLQATDIDSGLQLMLTGYVNDIKRVRLWDIPRSEYRKRVFHDLKIDRTAIWFKIIKTMLEDIGKKRADVIISENFTAHITEEQLSSLFYTALLDGENKRNISYEFLDVRSQISPEGEGLIYLKFKENYEALKQDIPYVYPSGSILEYIFVLQASPTGQYRVDRVIPFYYVDENRKLMRSNYPDEIKFEEHLNEWQSLFDIEEVILGDFLAGQITRRVEAFLASDERIFNTFNGAKVTVQYHKPENDTQPFFAIGFNVQLKNLNASITDSDWVVQEDMLYMLDAILKEFMLVLRGYHFDDYRYFEITNVTSPHAVLLERPNLELFRKGKISIDHLLKPPVSTLQGV